MHYGRLTFSKNGKPTIVRINDESIEFGRPDNRLSTLDIAEINELYDCSGLLLILNCGFRRSLQLQEKVIILMGNVSDKLSVTHYVELRH